MEKHFGYKNFWVEKPKECLELDIQQLWLVTSTNRHHGGRTPQIWGLVNNAKDGMIWHEQKHKHEGGFCDFCRAEWVDEGWRMIKKVDHDGATVHYEVTQIDFLNKKEV
jgi:hypothetical protein